MHHYPEIADELAKAWRATLTEGYKANDSEPKLVRRLCKATSKMKSSGRFQVGAKIIHGWGKKTLGEEGSMEEEGSIVEYKSNGETKSCELGDMVIVTRITHANEVLCQRLSIIQNKKYGDSDTSKPINEKQLELLCKLPPFKSKSKIINFLGDNEVHFNDPSGYLGAYGLFEPPGDMTYLNARVVEWLCYEDKRINDNKKRSIRLDAVKKLKDVYHSPHTLGYCIHGIPPELHPLYYRRAFCLGGTEYENDIEGFVKSWFAFRIGKLVKSEENVLDEEANIMADKIAEEVLDGDYGGGDSTNMGLFVLTINLGE